MQLPSLRNLRLSLTIMSHQRGCFFKIRKHRSRSPKTTVTHKTSEENRKNNIATQDRQLFTSIFKLTVSFIAVQMLLALLMLKNSATLAPGLAKLKCSQSVQSAATPSRPTRSSATEIVRPAGTTAWPGWEYLHQNSRHKISSSLHKN